VTAVDRSTLPRPHPSRPFVFPPIEKSSLPNGLRIWTVTHDVAPLVASMLLVDVGSADDPAGAEGLAALTADMLDEGSGARTAIDMSEALARIGAQFNAAIDADAMTFGLTTLRRFVGDGLAVLADMIVRPALRDEDFRRVRQLRLHRLAQLRDSPGAIAEQTFLDLLYGADPYGHSPLGRSAPLGALTVDDVHAFHAARIRPARTTLISVGDCTHGEIVGIAGEAFGGWDGGTQAGSPARPPVRPAIERGQPRGSRPRLAIVARPGAPQSELRIGHVAAARDTDDYHALVAANTVLGGQFVSRVNLNLRERKAFTYGARTWFEFRRWPGPFSMQTSVHTAATAAAIAESLDEIGAIRHDRPIGPAELELAVASLTNGFARNFETAGQIARATGQIARYGLPDDHYTTFVPRIRAVTPGGATDAFARHVDPGRLTTLIVGDLEAVADSLQTLALGAPVVVAPETF
jgi:zinc protease